jgi:eukaryotic-like serine/threonine-protein kinase
MSSGYQLLERLAVGGMGEVFLARQHGRGGFTRIVVIKRPLQDVDSDGEETRRLLDEARVSASLSHQNVVTVHEVGESHGHPFVAMEYVHGVAASTLYNRAQRREREIPVVVAARVVQDVARGLEHAHGAGIVHRDVAPKNILVRKDGVSKIADFGVAKAAHRMCRTATGAVPGTLSYMPPEQALNKDVTASSDQFALGVVFWEMLTHQRLFKGQSPAETLERVLCLTVPAPSSLRPEIPAEIDAVVMRMLERDPARRFANLGLVVRALEKALPALSGEDARAMVASTMEKLFGPDLRVRENRFTEEPATTNASTVVFRHVGHDHDDDDTPITRSSTAAVIETTKRPARRRLLAATCTAFAIVGILIGVALWPASLDHEQLTRDWIARKRVEAPLVFRASVMAHARDTDADPELIERAVDALSAVMKRRLIALDQHWRKDADERARHRPVLLEVLASTEADVDKAIEALPKELEYSARYDLLMQSSEPTTWVPFEGLPSFEVKQMIADARENAANDYEDALAAEAERLELDVEDARGVARRFTPELIRRIDLYEKSMRGVDVKNALALLDADVKERMKDHAPEGLADAAFVLWRARVEWPMRGEPYPVIGASPIEPLTP